MKQLERLLFLQGNRCFFCGESIPDGEASVEHLLANANGGTNDDANCVVCCKTINAALGHLSVKAKLQALLAQRPAFTCPANHGTPVPPVDSRKTNGRLTMIIADLRKRGKARPRRIGTLRNTINAVFQKQLSASELDVIILELKQQRYIAVKGSQVTYALPQDVV